MIKALKIDLPYPDVSVLKPNKYTASVIAPAYAGLHGEITATLQYLYHRFNFLQEKDVKTADTLLAISLAEMEHVELLGKTLLQLGVKPVYSLSPPYKYNFYNTSYVSYSNTPEKMLLDDITDELSAIAQYEEMIKRLDDECVQTIISRIILDEQLHVRVLKEIISKD